MSRDNYHHGNLPAVLLELGLEAIETEGREVLSLRALAERAGVSKTAPYRHFADKEAFLAALGNEGYRLLYEALRAASPATSEDSLGALGRAYFAFALERPALYRLMTSPLLCFTADEGTGHEGSAEPGWPRRALLFLADCLAESRAKRGSDPVPSPDAAAAAWAYIHGLVMIRIDGLFPLDYGRPDWDALAGLAPQLP